VADDVVGGSLHDHRMRTEVAITGGAAGLGSVVAGALLERGRPVVIIDRDEEQARIAAADLNDRCGAQVPVIVADLSTIAGIDTAADRLIERGAVGAVVNNAGGWSRGDQFPDADPEAWLATLTLNLLTPMILTQRLWSMLSVAAGAVVNIGSSGGEGDSAYGSPEYGAAKAGLRRFTASLGSRSEVRVMGVVPGWIGLARAHSEWAALTPDEQRRVGPLIPPEDIAKTVADLLDHGRSGEVVEILRNGTYRSTVGR
jgi:NAD(P)-dependent dehydrogenase (short-subunit alcohol dehydrogenase family)